MTRFETPAGRQAQVDFARFPFSWGVGYVLLVVPGYSRLLWCRFYPRQDMATLVEGLEEAFRYFGGVPQELLFDPMKAVITRDLRLEGGRARAQCGVCSLRASLGRHATRLSALSRAYEGQSRAPGPLPPGQFRLRPDVPATMPFLITSDSSGSSASRMCACTARRASVRRSASTARSGSC